MMNALRQPALQAAAGVGALIALTWPLLVFDRPLFVVCAFFVIWIAAIGLLFAFSRAPEHEIETRLSGAPPSEVDHDRGG
jgi:hypothetical protein